MAALELRPLEFGEILDHAIELYRRNLATLLGIYAVAALPYIAVATPLAVRSLTLAPGSSVDPREAALTGGAALLLILFYTVVLSPLATGAMTIAVSERFLGRPASLAGSYRRVLRHLGPLVVCLGLVAIPLLGALLAAMVGVVLLAWWIGSRFGWADAVRVTALATVLFMPALALIVLGFSTLFGFVPAAVVLEERGYRSLWRSLELAWAPRRRVFALLGVFFLMVLLVTAYVRLPSQLLAGAAGLEGSPASALLGALAMQLGILLVDPVRMVGTTLIYYDLRVRQEGFDLALLADELRTGYTAAAKGASQ